MRRFPGPGVTIITGCTRGLGAVMAQDMLLAGMPVVLTGRGADWHERLTEVVSDAESELKFRHETMKDRTGFSAESLPDELRYDLQPLDLDDKDSISALAHYCGTQIEDGHFTLVNNAAANYPGWTPDSVRSSIRTNVLGTIALTDAVAPHMKEDSQVLHMLCAQAMPRVGTLLSPALCGRLYDMTQMHPKRYSEALKRCNDFVDDPVMRGQENGALVFSKALQYTYACMHAKMQTVNRTGLIVNGTCPGSLGTGCTLSGSNRNPAHATGHIISNLSFDPQRSASAHSYYSMGKASNRKHPHGVFFTQTSMWPLEHVINPATPPTRGMGVTQARSETVVDTRRMQQAAEDWRQKWIAKRRPEPTAAEKVKSFFGFS
eukprot:Rhum_TRINITY_DN6213_c0_g1::Rhum_TRINITY_DN6213_c0_g1_i1::g.19430::m.19430